MEVTRLFDLLDYQQQTNPKEDCLANKVNGVWVKYSTQQVKDTVDKISLGLLALGIGRDDKIAIISPNRPEWNMVDYGIQQLGAVSVPVYPTATEEDYRFIFSDSEVKIIFVENPDLYKKAFNASKDLSHLIGIFSFHEIPGVKNWKELLEAGKGGDHASLKPYKDGVRP